MILGLWRKTSLAAKLLVSFVLLSVLPTGVLVALSSRHLGTIQDVSVHETQALLISSQLNRIRERLSQEAGRLSGVFSRLRDEAHTLRSYTESLLWDPSAFPYRNGSRYRMATDGSYGNPVDDGNSVLFANNYNPRFDYLVEATESLDLLLKPLVEREQRMVLGWVILQEGITRGYPWRDFGAMPREKDYTTWPFYFLADPDHNPSRGEVFTDVYLDPLGGEWMISCVSPVYVDGRHRATVGIDITIQSLLQEISEIRLSPEASSLLVANGEIIAASDNLPLASMGLDPGRPAHGQRLSDSSVGRIRTMIDESFFSDEGIEFVEADLQSFAGFALVAPPGWTLALLVPESDVLEPALESAEKVSTETSRIRRNFLHLLIFCLVAVVGLTWLVFAHQSRGLAGLLKGIRRLGQGDLNHRLEIGPGEFGHLAGALNVMAEGLHEKKRELQRAYAQVEEERKLAAVGRLGAGVAHEVNNPLATISTYTQMLLRRQDMPSDATHDLGIVMAEIRRIQEKLRNLLDLSRIQSPVLGPTDPNRLVEEVVGLARHEATERGIGVRTRLDPAVPEVALDRSGIKQVLWNLLGNALDAQPPGGDVWVRSLIREGELGSLWWILEVEDQGPGIPEATLARIFEPFFTTKPVGQGTGLGLAVSYRIVQGHGGVVEVENRSGGGCCFRVCLPVEETS